MGGNSGRSRSRAAEEVKLCDDASGNVGKRTAHAAAGGAEVATTAKVDGDLGDVEVATAA